MEHTATRLATQLESTRVARFQDCDPFGHLNNAKYIDYLLDARQDQIREAYGIEVVDADRGTSWVVGRFHIAFYRPIATLEPVVIRTQLLQSDERRLLVEGAFMSEPSRRLKSLAWVEFAHVDVGTGKPTNHADALLELLTNIAVGEEFVQRGFDARAMDVRGITRDLCTPQRPDSAQRDEGC